MSIVSTQQMARQAPGVRAKPTAVDLPDAEVAKSRYALIPPGCYELCFTHHETAIMFGMSHKLILWFNVINCGEYFEVQVARFYNVEHVIGKPGRNGRFKAKASGDFLLDYYTMFNPGKRLDRISLDPFRNNIILGNVATVTVTSTQRGLPEEMQYSVIRSFAGVMKP